MKRLLSFLTQTIMNESKVLRQQQRNQGPSLEKMAEDQLTDYLKNSENFKNASHKIHSAGQKFWEKIDEAAFPEEHKAKKGITHKPGTNSKSKK